MPHLRSAWRCSRRTATGCFASCLEGEAASRRAEYQLIRQLLFGEIDEVLATAMHRQHMSEVEFLKLSHDLAQVVVRCWRQVKPADQRVNPLDPGYLLRASE